MKKSINLQKKTAALLLAICFAAPLLSPLPALINADIFLKGFNEPGGRIVYDTVRRRDIRPAAGRKTGGNISLHRGN